MTEATGTGSRDIDLPNGGLAIIIGNLIQQGPNTQNNTMLGYGLEGLINTVPHQLYIINNTFVNERGKMGIFINTNSATALLKAYNNLFTGQPYTFLSGSAIVIDTLANLMLPEPAKAGFINLSGYNYDLVSNSPCINKGTYPGSAADFSLVPKYQYINPMKFKNRYVDATIDIGACEYGVATSIKKDNTINNSFKFHNFPSEGKVIISSDQNISSGTVRIYDISGKLVDHATRLSDNSFEWNYFLIRKGVYIIKIKLKQGTVVKKLVVNP